MGSVTIVSTELEVGLVQCGFASVKISFGRVALECLLLTSTLQGTRNSNRNSRLLNISTNESVLVTLKLAGMPVELSLVGTDMCRFIIAM
jgi:hypothetical protein